MRKVGKGTESIRSGMTHVHLWHLGHYDPYLEDIEKLGMVEHFQQWGG